MPIIRQGDVLLISTDKTGDEAAPKDPRGLVLAEGETSGHYHAVTGRGHKLYQLRNTSDRLLVVGKAGADLRVIGGGSGGVDRHTPVSLAPGKYLVRVQRSWSSELASRQVSD